MNASHVNIAAELLASCNLVAFPTETVYGLGADARSDAAVRKIYEAKGRPSGNPIIVHVADEAAARAAAGGWNDNAAALAQKFWPGPLTLILPRGTGISPLVSAGRNTVALRCPNHPVASALLRHFSGPIAAPSANRSGFVSPTTAQHVYAELNGRIPMILDGGECSIGIESTVLDISTPTPRLLRPGAITADMLQSVVGEIEIVQSIVSESDSAASPGQHARHYAPRTTAYSFDRRQWNVCGPSVTRFAGLTSTMPGRVALLTHDPAFNLPPPHEVLLMPADAAAYAKTLYASLRQADELHASSILILKPDNTDGIWAAIHDRLNRATKPFPTGGES